MLGLPKLRCQSARLQESPLRQRTRHTASAELSFWGREENKTRNNSRAIMREWSRRLPKKSWGHPGELGSSKWCHWVEFLETHPAPPYISCSTRKDETASSPPTTMQPISLLFNVNLSSSSLLTLLLPHLAPWVIGGPPAEGLEGYEADTKPTSALLSPWAAERQWLAALPKAQR